MEGIRRVDEWNRIREKIPDDQVVFETARETSTEFLATLTDEEKVVLSYVDGKRAVLEITRASGLGKMEAHKPIYSLLTAGVIRPVVEEEQQMTYREDTTELLDVLSTYNYIFQLLYKVTVGKIGKEATELFTQTLHSDEPGRADLFANVNWNSEGQLPENLLVANVSRAPLRAAPPAPQRGAVQSALQPRNPGREAPQRSREGEGLPDHRPGHGAVESRPR